MRYALIDNETGQLQAIQDLDSPEHWTFPEGFDLVDATGFYPEHEVWEYYYKNGRFVWREPDPEPLNPLDVIKSIYAADPALTVGLPDSIALRMIPYLPTYDQSQTYTTGMLMVKDGEVWRKTLTGWRAVE